MGKKNKKSGRTPSQSDVHAERAERRREAHARLVIERTGDPNYVQQTRAATGRTLSWTPESPAGAEVSDALKRQLQAFTDKFGREPGPDDPVFFDPDKDEPEFMGPEAEERQWTALFDAADKAGLDPAFIHAWREVGYVVTEDNQHMLTAIEVEAFEEAVRRHRDDSEQSFGDDDGVADFDALLEDTEHGLEVLVGQTLLDGGDTRPALRLVAALLAHLADDDEGDDGTVMSIMFGCLLGWLVSAREHGIDATASVNWVRVNLGDDAGETVLTLSGLVGHPLAPDLTVNEVHERIGPMFLAAMLWLCAGVVATNGDGDVHWLRQFDVGSN